MTDSIKVDVWSDIACPFCYIGKRRFEAAVTAANIPVDVEYHSFQLSPDTPTDVEGDHAEFLARHKGIPVDRARGMITHVVDLAAEVGLEYDYDRLITTNTGKAHELIHHAKEHGRQADMKERLLAAYFVEGAHVGQVAVLADLAAEVGLDRADTERALTDGRYADAVRADQERAAEYGISAVPFFVFDAKYGLSGAQPEDTFVAVLNQVREARQPAS